MDGCALGTVQIVGSNLLKVSGPASIVSQIDTAVATINVEGMSTDVTDSVVPVLYDADGNVIDTTKLTLSLSTVNISAQILNTKDVPLEFEAKGEPADGYVLTGVESSLDNVRIKGRGGNAQYRQQDHHSAGGAGHFWYHRGSDHNGGYQFLSAESNGTCAELGCKSRGDREGGAGCQGDLRGQWQTLPFRMCDGYNANYMESTVAVEISGARASLRESLQKILPERRTHPTLERASIT